MEPEKCDQLRIALRNLARSHAATMEFMEKTLALLSDELSIDPLTFWHSQAAVSSDSGGRPHLDYDLLSVTYHGRSCFLGNTVLFRLLAHLIRRPNRYSDYEQLLSAVWQGVRSDATVRSAVKRLRTVLRKAGLTDLADAIDGSVPGHYAMTFQS